MDDISKKEINIIDILFTIKEDVSSIKTDMVNFKESQKLERERFNKELEEQNNTFNKNISEVKKDIKSGNWFPPRFPNLTVKSSLPYLHVVNITPSFIETYKWGKYDSLYDSSTF